MHLTIAYSEIKKKKKKKRNLVLINNDTYQRETLTEWPIRLPVSYHEGVSQPSGFFTRKSPFQIKFLMDFISLLGDYIKTKYSKTELKNMFRFSNQSVVKHWFLWTQKLVPRGPFSSVALYPTFIFLFLFFFIFLYFFIYFIYLFFWRKLPQNI